MRCLGPLRVTVLPYAGASVCTMKPHAASPLQALAVGIALLRGAGEFVALLRWRLKTALAQRGRGN